MWSPWFRRILVNAANDHIRNTKRLQALRESEKGWVDGPSKLADRDRVRCLLMSLQSEKGTLVALRFGRDFEVPEIARLFVGRSGPPNRGSTAS